MKLQDVVARASLVLGLIAPSLFAGEQAFRPLVAQMPSLSAAHVAFNHGGELWIVSREGGTARRLTTGAGVPSTGGSAFSPDGSRIAFTATYGGDADVYVLDVEGAGKPQRLTFDQRSDEAIGWSRSGDRVLFRSARQTFYDGYGLPRAYSVDLAAGRPLPLPFPLAYNVAFATDGRLAAVEPQQLVNTSWKQYRGGDQRRIVLTDAVTLGERPLPGPPANDFDPMWVEDTLYFVSDRSGRQALHAYTSSGEVRQLFDPGWRDIKSASLGPGAIVFSRIDGIGLYDLESGQAHMLSIDTGLQAGVEDLTVDLAHHIVDAAIADDGRVAFEARGRVALVDLKGRIASLGASGHALRVPEFRSDSRLSVFSDESGNYRLATYDLEESEVFQSLGMQGSALHTGVVWSRDGKVGLSVDSAFNYWVHVEGMPSQRIDRESKAIPWLVPDAAWSPDGSKLAYARTLENGLFAVFVWRADGSPPRQASPEGVDARSPAWDADGRRLWFTASNNTPPINTYLDQSEKVRPPSTRVLMSVVEGDDGWTDVIRNPLPEKRYERVIATDVPGTLLLLETMLPASGSHIGMPMRQELWQVDADEAESEPVLLVGDIETIYPGELYGRANTTFRVSPRYDRVLFRRQGDWMRLSIGGDEQAEPRKVDLSEAAVTIDPRAEWRQMFDDAFRLLEDYFHDGRRSRPDFGEWKARYSPLLDGLGGREDLTWLLEDIAGELHMSHATVSRPRPLDPLVNKVAQTGALAIDVEPDEGRYRITRIYRGDIAGLGPPAPLDGRDLDARPGDLIDSIGGKSVSASRDLAEYLVGRAGQPTELCLSSSRAGTRCAEVIPTANEASFRFAAWREENRALVDRLSGGRLGYIHLSDTIETGLRQFNQARYAQHGREGFVLDVRYNSGGYAADYVIEQLDMRPMSRMVMPHGRVMSIPGARLGGPKALLINGYCGSGCDTLSWYFKHFHVGPLIGTPTWGGVSGSGNAPTLIDGGWFTVPAYTMTDAEGNFVLEGEAVEPTIPVPISAAADVAGEDPQLLRAVSELLDALDRHE